jgi:hypothetical protein
MRELVQWTSPTVGAGKRTGGDGCESWSNGRALTVVAGEQAGTENEVIGRLILAGAPISVTGGLRGSRPKTVLQPDHYSVPSVTL